MSAVWWWLSAFFGMAHFGLAVAVMAGGPIALRRPRFARLHLALVVLTISVFAVGAQCPLTVWQKACLRRAGRTPYEGGFISHYVMGPLTGGRANPFLTGVMFFAWFAPTAISYAMVVRRRQADVAVATTNK